MVDSRVNSDLINRSTNYRIPELVYTIGEGDEAVTYSLPIPTIQSYSDSHPKGVNEHPTTVKDFSTQFTKTSAPSFTIEFLVMDYIRINQVTTSGTIQLSWSIDRVIDSLRQLYNNGTEFSIIGDSKLYWDLYDLVLEDWPVSQDADTKDMFTITLACKKNRHAKVETQFIEEYVIDGLGNTSSSGGSGSATWVWVDGQAASDWLVNNIPMKYRLELEKRYALSEPKKTGFFRLNINNGTLGKIPVRDGLLSGTFRTEIKQNLRCMICPPAIPYNENDFAQFEIPFNFSFHVNTNDTPVYVNYGQIYKRNTEGLYDGKTIIPDNKFFMFSPNSGYKSDSKIIYQLATLYPKIMSDIGMSIGLDQPFGNLGETYGNLGSVVDSYYYTYPTSPISLADVYNLREAGFIERWTGVNDGNYGFFALTPIWKHMNELAMSSQGAYSYIDMGVIRNSAITPCSLILEEVGLNKNNVSNYMISHPEFYMSQVFHETIPSETPKSSYTSDMVIRGLGKGGWKLYNIKLIDQDKSVSFKIDYTVSDESGGKNTILANNLRPSSFPVTNKLLKLTDGNVKLKGTQYPSTIPVQFECYKVGNYLVPLLIPVGFDIMRIA